ncbi:hypothetical protein DICPUDRAFT_157225 [Dictyostelium purpureum]|uniref:SAM domain-containing protein n=1 Tax=Dictyostelium purpureum TaxID=5786 RepID=F0ZYL4_DICPU|nr:uncharacterized protein DICPUDRAFT_157225 [Dictyostelium purpureum]XP_003294350.1 uncharacterized protein DICPUDRAFT_159343 [Dictyostelium purpureum]EGC29121.1 hypothetical protein DICPUDRAFT_159343 [Dictyostelium purpureum]EGC30962.1 hypothetical protein DICPUDRAFT_157225 [Dictyostelium purpureum]|eukprot:XP_003292513.1 hypothetical protein DICPUDRAFT_157225 [Dictyostelium purpureum]
MNKPLYNNTVYSKDSRDTVNDWSSKKVSEWLTSLKFPIEIISNLKARVIDGRTFLTVYQMMFN